MGNIQYTHILWDFNGTILDDVKTGIDCVNVLLEKRGLKTITDKDYYREVIIIDDKGNIIERFKNKSEYYKIMTEKYNIGRTFLELWIKRRDVYTNPKKLKKFIPLTDKRVLYYDEFITENV